MWKIGRPIFTKIVVMLLISVLLVTGCGTRTPLTPLGSFEEGSIRIGLITDQYGTGSLYYSQAWEGLQKAEQELGVGIAYLKAKDEKAFTSRLKEFKKHQTDLILAFGEHYIPAVLEAAKANPDIKYIIIDTKTGETLPDNVLAVSYKDEEAAFLAGHIAGRMTKTNVIGYITGRNDETSERYYFGFKAGLRSANAYCELMKGLAATFTNKKRVEKIAERMLESKADVIFHLAGTAGNGMIDAVEKADKHAIGSGTDQLSLAPENVISSVVRNNDVVIYNLVEKFKDEKLNFGEKVKYGLAEGAVGLSETTKDAIPQTIYNSVLEQKEKIIAGELVIPDNENDYLKFVAN